MEFCPWVKPRTDDEEMLAGIFMIANDLEEAPRTPIVDYASKDTKKSATPCRTFSFIRDFLAIYNLASFIPHVTLSPAVLARGKH